ncbi:esterase-like activity of phytase family protein [Pseudomonas sp. CAU 1711]|uniref:esterase-like activity of phytase family protein n=1 Tax=Pseudomonas sp. CAU 1711 TaxID=3140356 RepID=UPI003261AAB1
MRRAVALLALLGAGLAGAQEREPQALSLVAEHRIEGLESGHLSGLARCGGEWLALSDRDDERFYRLQPGEQAWQAEALRFDAPPPPASALPWGLRARTWTVGRLRGGMLDFEALSCDAQGNRYLLSEAYAGVLRIAPGGPAEWLQLPDTLIRQARASGMLLSHNALFEGLAVAPNGETLWLAAERERRGLLVLHKSGSRWRCSGGCVLQSESGQRRSPLEAQSDKRHPLDFSDLVLHEGKLFTLQRLEHLICRRDPSNGEQEKCWSFADTASPAARRYPQPWGSAEALVLNAEGAWVGLDNDGQVRGDGERRSLLWQFKAPAGGWGAK